MTNSTYVMFVEAKNTLSISPWYWWSCILSPHQYQDHDSFPDDFTQHYCQNSSSYWSQKEVLFDWLVVLVSLHSLYEALHIATVRVDHNKLLGSHVAQVRAVTRSLYLHDSLHTGCQPNWEVTINNTWQYEVELNNVYDA